MSEDRAKGNAEAELLASIGELLNGAATVEQRVRLNDLLAADEDARATYRRYVNLHVALRMCYAMPGGPPEWPGLTAADEAAGSPPAAAGPAKLSRGPWSPTLRSLAVTAFAAALLVAVLLHFLPFGVPQPDASDAAAGPIAKITKAVGVRWAAEPESLAAGGDLRPGTLDLADGLVELALESGVRVVLEAPVEIELIDSGAARLQRGRVVAHVPPRGRGFSIETPRARVVDYGTEFGVGVRDGGDTEVQVFQGVVVAEWKDPAGKIVDHRVDAGQAVVIDGQTGLVPKGVPYYPEGFVRTFPADREPDEPGGPLYNRSRFDSVHVVPAPGKPTIDGDLSDWDRSGAFYSACLPPYHENYYLEGLMMYDEKFVYIGAHVGDPAPMRSVMDPQADPREYPWRGGSVIVRLSVSPELGWPLTGQGPAERDRFGTPGGGRRPEDVGEQIVHLTMWYHSPTGKPRLLLSSGLDFHGERYDPDGSQGAFRMDPNGRGYTLEYAIPWSALNAAQRPPRAGDVLGANWTVHWSDEEGKLSRGNLVEITNLANPPYRFLRASTWGKAIYHDRGHLPPGTAAPKRRPGAAP